MTRPMTARNWSKSLCCAALAALAMALVPSVGKGANKAAVKIAPGETAPDFELVDSSGATHTLSDYLDGETIVVLEWFNPNCSYDKIHYGTEMRTMQTLHEKYSDKGVVWLAINSGCEASGTADPALSESRREEWGMEYPVLLDTDGSVGRLFHAKTTPQMYVIEPGGTFAYMGAVDSQPYLLNIGDGDAPEVTNHVENALDDLLAGRAVRKSVVRTYGCKIKY